MYPCTVLIIDETLMHAEVHASICLLLKPRAWHAKASMMMHCRCWPSKKPGRAQSSMGWTL